MSQTEDADGELQTIEAQIAALTPTTRASFIGRLVVNAKAQKLRVGSKQKREGQLALEPALEAQTESARKSDPNAIAATVVTPRPQALVEPARTSLPCAIVMADAAKWTLDEGEREFEGTDWTRLMSDDGACVRVPPLKVRLKRAAASGRWPGGCQ